MIDYRKIIKRSIQNLPGGVSILLPGVKPIIRYIDRLKKIADEKTEAHYIMKRLKLDDFDEVVIVYDLKVSPPTYGDFFYVVMIARFFLMQGKKVKYYIIDSEFSKDALEAYGDEGCKSLVARLSELPEVILKYENCDIKIMNWGHFSKIMDNVKNAKEKLLVFKRRIIKRKSIYDYCFNLINGLVSSMNNDQIGKFLLSKKDIEPGVDIKCPQTRYITWGARYSEKWGFDRNMKPEEFLIIHKSLHSRYPNHAVMIVSDESGCAFFKKLAWENNLPCLFSKDFSGTFMGDCALVLGSEYFFQLRGGGISCAALFSDIPYEMVQEPVHERIKQNGKYAIWSSNDQKFVLFR